MRELSIEAEDGTPLAVGALEPRGRACAGAVVVVPPGLEPGLPLLETAPAEAWAAAGLRVFAFDPRGRGQSAGEEDANGATGQDDLARLLRAVADLDRVDPDRVVLYSRSLGGALAAGALARHPDLAPVAWVDWESPGWLESDLSHAAAFTRERMQELAEASGDPEAFWAEREPAGFVGEVAAPYHRLQGLPDHALGTYLGHAEAMVDGATAAPDVRLNGEAVTPPLGLDGIEARAVEGGISPDAPGVIQAVLEAAGG